MRYKAGTLNNLGVLLLAFAFYRIDKTRPYPGTWALLPVLGAFCLIAAGTNAWFNRYVLANRAMVGIGLISYPLYLWHWPLLTFARIVESETPAIKFRVAALSTGCAGRPTFRARAAAHLVPLVQKTTVSCTHKRDGVSTRR